MKLAIIIVTSSEQIHVKVLHTLLKLNAVVHNSAISCNMQFCDNDPVSRATTFNTILNGNYDKTVWLEEDTYIPFENIVKIINTHAAEEFVVFSSMKSHVDWDQFSEFTRNSTADTEPLQMRGIVPDVDLIHNYTKEHGELLSIRQSDLRTFVMSNKRIQRKLKKKFKNTKYHYTGKEHNGNYLSASENLCRLLRESGVQLKVLVDTDVTRYFKHEHIGRIMDTLDVKIRERPAVSLSE